MAEPALWWGYDSIETVVIGNLNGDALPDIAVREIYSGLLVTLHGSNGGNSFVERQVLRLGDRTFALAAGNVNGDGFTGSIADLNADGYPDLIVGEQYGIGVLLNCAGQPRITSVSLQDGAPTITWTACAGLTYRVQCKDRLEDAEWTDLEGEVRATGPTASKVHDHLPRVEQRFYRVLTF